MEIYSYGNVEAVIGVLHYLVMLFGTDDFMDIVRTALVIGFIVAACASVMQMTHRGWTWLLTVMVVYAVCFIPKTSVLVTDKLGIEPPAAVANVPWLAGFLFSIKSQVGHTLVQLTETALQTIPDPRFALPAELSYEEHGIAFGNRLIRETRTASLPDTQLRADVIAYVRNCVYPEVGKSLDANAIARAIPLWPALAVANPALVTTYTPIAGVITVSPCPDVYNLITLRFPAEQTMMLQSLAANVSPGVPIAQAVMRVGPAVEAAYVKTTLGTAAMNAGDILLHNALINHFAETGQVMAGAASDPAAVLMAMAQSHATAQANASYMMQTRLAEEASPIVRNVIEILLLGFFPVVCVLLLVTEGRRTVMFLVGYLYALLWVELWPFTYAILNFVHTTYAAKEISASAFTNPGNALTLMTSGLVYTTTLSTSAIAGWMIIAVPTLSAALLWGFDKIVGAVPSLAAMLGGAGSTAAAAAIGNISQSNISMGQQLLSPQTSSAWFSSVQHDVTGDTHIFGMKAGVSAFKALKNDSFIRGALEAQEGATATEQASNATEAALRESHMAQATAVAAFGRALSSGKGVVATQELAKIVGTEQAASDSKRASSIIATAQDYKSTWGVTDQQAVAIVIAAQTGLSLRGLASTGVDLGINGQNASTIQRDFNTISSNTSRTQAEETQDFLRRVATSQRYQTAVTSSQEERELLTARLERAATHAHNAEASFVERDAFLKTAQLAYTRARNLGYDWTSDPRHSQLVERLSHAVGGRSLSQAQLYLDAELARDGVLGRPTNYLDRTATRKPSSVFEDLQRDPRVANVTDAQHAQDRKEVGPRNLERVEPPANLRWADGHGGPDRQSRLEHAENAIEGKLQREAAALELRRLQVDKELDLRDDGTGSKQSLVLRAGENAAKDTAAMANERITPRVQDGLKTLNKMLGRESK